MKVHVCVIIFLTAVCSSHCGIHDWDMAVTVGNNVEFLDQNATLVGVSHQVFHNLKAITFDDIRHEFVVSDMNEENDTIFRMKLSDTKNPVAIVPDIKDDVVDVAVDPIDDVLYWVDSLQRTIMKISLNDSEAQSEVLFKFDDEIPQGLAIDSCRRKLYWTNANHPMASIERSNLDGTEREVIISGNLFMPSGIVIDHASRKFYWTDLGEGIYFRIESARLDGSNRKIVYQDTHQQPFRIAVSESFIYWTDVTSYAIWGIKKETGLKPEILRRFNEKPKGLITRNHDLINLPECQEVVDAINNYHSTSGEDIVPVNNSDYCLNFGELTPFGCKCSRGFTGPRCEINLCHNLCFNGICYQSSQGYPKCKCYIGYTGERCEFEMCKNFCMNGGSCTPSLTNSTWPSCKCQEEFSGIRCEKRNDFEPPCTCEDGEIIRPLDGARPYCSCPSDSTPSPLNLQAPLSSISQQSFFDRLHDPLVLGFMFASFLLLLVTLMLSAMMCKLRHRRPRIKKRIIVNKNVTPLTCRPNPQAEQCEITIEDCCNMNICETPCFEPTSLRGFQRNKTEEKKTLLTCMENGEDLY